MNAISMVDAREGYRRWAPTYESETAISVLEDRLVESSGAPTAGCRLLDVGCGTGRRLRAGAGARATLAVGVDLVPEMLARARAGDAAHASDAGDAGGSERALAAADLRALPFADGAFDVVWCRLVIGHVAELGAAYAELARVCATGGMVVVTDFHPDAVAAGHRRTFRDATGVLRAIEHHVHAPEAHEREAAAAGLELAARRDGEVGPLVRHFYASANRLEAYEAQMGLRIVLALAFRRAAARP